MTSYILPVNGYDGNCFRESGHRKRKYIILNHILLGGISENSSVIAVTASEHGEIIMLNLCMVGYSELDTRIYT